MQIWARTKDFANYKSKCKKVEVLPNIKHRYSAGRSSLVPREQHYPPSFTLSWARQEPTRSFEKWCARNPWTVAYGIPIQLLNINFTVFIPTFHSHAKVSWLDFPSMHRECRILAHETGNNVGASCKERKISWNLVRTVVLTRQPSSCLLNGLYRF